MRKLGHGLGTNGELQGEAAGLCTAEKGGALHPTQGLFAPTLISFHLIPFQCELKLRMKSWVRKNALWETLDKATEHSFLNPVQFLSNNGPSERYSEKAGITQRTFCLLFLISFNFCKIPNRGCALDARDFQPPTFSMPTAAVTPSYITHVPAPHPD